MKKSIAELKQGVDIVSIIGARVSLKKKGTEHVGMCPFHTDKRPSLMVNQSKQVFGCFACGEKGDVIDFLVKFGSTFSEALKILGGGNGITSGSPVKNTSTAPLKKKAEWRPLIPAPEPGNILHYRHGKPSKVWRWHDQRGQLVFLSCRFDYMEKGKPAKDILPYSFCQNGTRRSWRWQSIPKPRPLYNLHLIKSKPAATVLIVEGEKTADAAQRLFPHVIATCWPGGANAIGMVNWESLKGRRVLLWPDNDKTQRYGQNHPMAGKIKPFHEQPGNKAMLKIATIIRSYTAVLKWVNNDPGFPDKWDVADADDWTPETARKYAKENLIDIPYKTESIGTTGPDPEVTQAKQPSTPSVAGGSPERPSIQPKPPRPSNRVKRDDYSEFFVFLGFTKEGESVKYAFYVKETRTVHQYGLSRLSKTATLIGLAPLSFWEDNFTTGKQRRINTDMVVNWIARTAHTVGFFSPDRMRGRGAWMDDKKVVIHAGDRLVIDGKPVRMADHESHYIYEASNPLDLDVKLPLSTPAANKLLDIVKLLNWERPVNAHLLAGWCVVSILCGALTWRPHIWVTGAAGTGKSWVFNNIVRTLLGKMCFAVQSKTTEPGLRQLLKSDALPVVFDEAEGEDTKALARMDDVLGLMRASSADDGGLIVMGTSGGGGMQYRIRTCFAFASIGVSAHLQSDKTRISVLGLKNPPNMQLKKDRWADLQKLYAQVITDEYVSQLQARTIALMPVILENSKTFSAAGAAVLGDQRQGDQIGPMLAGAYSLASTKLITLADAIDWIRGHDWNEEISLDENKDEIRCLNFILEQTTRIDAGGKGHTERTIGELILTAARFRQDTFISDTAAHDRLKRLGIKIESTPVDDGEIDFMLISNGSMAIKRMLNRTPWAHNHHKILERIPGTIQMPPVYFSAGVRSRSVAIPINELYDDLTKIEIEDDTNE